MCNDNLKKEIKQTLLRKDGKLNSAVTRRKSFKRSTLLKQIIEHTHFLDDDCKLPERIYCILHDINELQRCVICLSPAIFLPNFNRGYSKTCNNQSCKTRNSTSKRINTNIKKYGAKISPLTLQRIKERTGQLQIKGRKTLKQKYNVNNPGELPGHALKLKNTISKRYGVNSTNQIPHVKANRLQNRIYHFNSLAKDTNVRVENIITRNSDKNLYDVEFTCNVCNVSHIISSETFKWRCSNNVTPCTHCLDLSNRSVPEIEIHQFITSIGDFDIITNTRSIIPPFELDLYIPECNLAIEFNGLFWHSTKDINDHNNRSRRRKKTHECNKKGIRLIHIFENEWANKKEIVKSRIRNALGANNDNVIYARQCKVVELPTKESTTFLNNNHIQGYVGASCRLGLEFAGELVACMTFGKSRYSKFEWELLRFSNKKDTRVIGGASKLFNYFVKLHKPSSIVSYADKRWATLTPFYSKLGFKYSHTSDPNYFYYHQKYGMRLFSRVNFQKHKLEGKLDLFDPSLSETVNMYNNGYRKIWDCGNDVFVWKRHET